MKLVKHLLNTVEATGVTATVFANGNIQAQGIAIGEPGDGSRYELMVLV